MKATLICSHLNEDEQVPTYHVVGRSLFIMGNEVVKHQANIKVSIDRITVVGNYASERLDNDMREWLRKPFVQDVDGGLQIFDDNNCYRDDFGNRHAYVAPEQVAFINSPKFLKDKIRIDFNPNHGLQSEGGQWLLKLIASIPEKHFSRCDIAFDLFNEPTAKDYQVWRFGTGKQIILNRKSQMETTYYGSMKSGQQIRQYNKKVEQEARHGKTINVESWWRVELQLRGNKVQDYPRLVQKMLEEFYIPEYKTLKNPSQQAMVYAMMNEPTIYGNASEKTRQRWRKLLKETPTENRLSVEMAKKFVADFQRLEYELQSIMNRFNVIAEENDTINL